MNEKLWFKIFTSVSLIVGMTIIGFIAVIVAAVAGGGKFYLFLTGAITLGLCISACIRIFVGTRLRVQRLSLLIFLLLCGLSAVGYEIRGHLYKVPVMSEQDIVLQTYQPFQSGSRVAALDEASSLKLRADLPRLDGATALYPLYSAFAQAVYPPKTYDLSDSEVMVNTTPGAYDNLMEGRADIIFTAAPSKLQLAEAKRKGLELKLTPIGIEAFVFFVNAKNPVKGLSTEQIRDIYSGKITNWRAVGGREKKIRAFQRPENSGSQTMLQKLMEGRTLAQPPKEDVVSAMDGIIQRTADYRNSKDALGYSFLFYVTQMVRNGNIRLLEVDGVKPDKTAIINGTYPLAAEFYAITLGSGGNPNADPFIKWILSSQGQSLVEKTGYTPINSGSY